MVKREISPLKKHIEETPSIRALKEKRHRRRKRVRFFLAVLFFLFVGGFVYAARYPRLQLTAIVVSGNQVVDTDDVTQEVQKYLAGNYAYVIPRRNAFFYPKQEITADLLAKFPRFKTVAAYRTTFTSLEVDVTEVKGRALWCGEDATAIPADATCYFTDENGKIVSLSPQYSGNVYPRFFGGSIDPADQDPTGKTFIDPASFQNLLVFETKLQGLGFNVQGLLIGTDEEDTFVIDLGGGATGLIRFNKDDDYPTLVANLTAALTKSEFSGELKSDEQNLQYIDLRFTNKVYYKFSDDGADTIPAGASASATGSYEDQH